MRRLSKLGLALSLPYLVVCVAAFAYVVYRLEFQPANSELLGVFLLLLSLPWSMLSVNLLGRLGGMWPVTAALAGFCLLNALLLYAAGTWLGRLFSPPVRRD